MSGTVKRAVMPAWLRMLRPHQWLKNSFVFVGLLFGHGWHDPRLVTLSLTAFATFCLLASAVYVVNDVVDREQDRLHPQKRHRPVASGELGVATALVLGALCGVGGLALAAWAGGGLLGLGLAYLVLNAAYCAAAKHVVLLDVFMIATGFMLRILAGTWGIGIAPSQWLLLCGFSLTLFLGFAKRRAELRVMKQGSTNHRKVLAQYSTALLDQMIAVVVSAVVVTYSLYTVSPETIALHGTGQLIVTVPFVLFGLFRYLYVLHVRDGGGDPAVELLRDRHLQLAVAGWLAVTVGVLGRWV